MQIVQHSSQTNEAYTPAWLVGMSREVLGGDIDLDPASCAAAQAVVQAGTVHCAPPEGQLGGLGVPWFGRVFLNPPGGKLDRATLLPIPRNAEGRQGGPGLSSAAVWWGKLWLDWERGSVHSAIYICFSLSVLRTAQDPELGVRGIQQFPFCVPRDRVNYDRLVWVDTSGLDGQCGWFRTPTKGAPADSAIVYLPPKGIPSAQNGWSTHERLEGLARFKKVFDQIGEVRL